MSSCPACCCHWSWPLLDAHTAPPPPALAAAAAAVISDVGAAAEVEGPAAIPSVAAAAGAAAALPAIPVRPYTPAPLATDIFLAVAVRSASASSTQAQPVRGAPAPSPAATANPAPPAEPAARAACRWRALRASAAMADSRNSCAPRMVWRETCWISCMSSWSESCP